jgi:hypothetical protein
MQSTDRRRSWIPSPCSGSNSSRSVSTIVDLIAIASTEEDPPPRGSNSNGAELLRFRKLYLKTCRPEAGELPGECCGEMQRVRCADKVDKHHPIFESQSAQEAKPHRLYPSSELIAIRKEFKQIQLV